VAAARALWPPPADGRHVVDVLLEERAPRLMRSPFWPLLKAPLFALLDYRRARESADAIKELGGSAALDYVSALLRLDVRAQNLARIPRSGRCVIVANHPTGIADGVALYDALLPLRPDLCFFANADALRVCPGFTDVLIPVEWMKERRSVEKTKLTLSMAQRALAEERAVVIFPAGAPARRFGVIIKEPPWERSALSLARKHAAPLVPVRVSGPCSYLYHAFDLVSRELRNVTLFRELLNKAGKRYDLTVGPLIEPSALEGDAETATRGLRAYVARTLAHAPDLAFA
jgi:putative hemolysin